MWNQTTYADNLTDTTIIEGFTNNVCPIHKTLGEVCIINIKSLSDIIEDFGFLIRVDTPAQRLQGIAQGYPSLSTLVPMNRPSSEPLPLVFAVAMTLKPALGRTNLPIFLRKTSISFKDRLETENLIRGKVDLVKEQDSTSFECFND